VVICFSVYDTVQNSLMQFQTMQPVGNLSFPRE